jgi:glycosyltransferase involved in cell wall biosynthesis
MSPSVSLCMIVRDESEMLPRFFQAAAGLWDELIVVDTGSRDDTVALAVQAGARVIHHPWTENFAEARNAGLQAAAGEWILILDADEMATPALAPAVRAVTADPRVGAATLRMRNDFADGHVRTAPLLRLFRRDPAIRFRHRIHEEVATDVGAYLHRTGRLLAAIPAEVVHLGYGRERAAARGKKDRDQRLLELSVHEDPRDFYSWFKLLELLRFWSDADAAREAGRQCLSELARTGPTALAQAPFGGELIALAVTAFAGHDPGTAGRLMDLWLPNLLPSAAFSLRRGEIAEGLGQPDRARREFQRCLALRDHHGGDPQLVTVRPMMGLARLALAEGRLAEALALTREALGFNAQDPEARLAAATLVRLVPVDTTRRAPVDDTTPVRRAAG